MNYFIPNANVRCPACSGDIELQDIQIYDEVQCMECNEIFTLQATSPVTFIDGSGEEVRAEEL